MSADSTHPLATKRVVIGHLTICQGCCCGNTENGRPPVPVEWLKREWRARGLLKRVQLTISGCLGPCESSKCGDHLGRKGDAMVWGDYGIRAISGSRRLGGSIQGRGRIAAPSNRISATHAASVSQVGRSTNQTENFALWRISNAEATLGWIAGSVSDSRSGEGAE